MSKRTKVCYNDDLESFILGIKEDGHHQHQELEHVQKSEGLVLDIYGLIWNDIFEGICIKLHVFDNYRIAKKEIRLCLYLKYLVCHTFNRCLEYKVYILHSIETAINMLRYIIYFEEYGYAPRNKINQCKLYWHYLSNHIKQKSNDTITVIIEKSHLSCDKQKDAHEEHEEIASLIKKTFGQLDNNKLRIAAALNGYICHHSVKRSKRTNIRVHPTSTTTTTTIATADTTASYDYYSNLLDDC